MATLKFDEALELKGRKFEDLEVPELGGQLKIAAMPAGRALEFKELHGKRDKGIEHLERKQMVTLLMGGVVNEDRSPFFADEKKANLFIDKVSFDTLQLIVKKITEMMQTAAGDGKPEGEPKNP